MILQKLLIIATILTSSYLAVAEDTITYNGWTSGNFWGGGYVQEVILAPSNPERCYARIDMAGLYRSDDAGNTWRMLHGALPLYIGLQMRGLSVDPRNADHIIIVVAAKDRFNPGYILVSQDAGESFQETGRLEVDNWAWRATGFIIDRSPQNPDIVFVAGYDSILRSQDNGQTWDKVFNQPINPTDIRFDQTNPQRLWLCSPAAMQENTGKILRYTDYNPGFYTSTDAGQNWEKIADESPTEIVQALNTPYELYAIFDFSTIKRSDDHGYTWTDCSTGLEKTAIEYHDRWCNKNIYTALAAGNDFIVTASTLKDFYYLQQGSDTWEKINITAVDPGAYLNAKNIEVQAFKATGSITIDPNNPQHWYATDYYNVLQTFDAGRTWRCTSTGMSQVVVQNVFVLPGTDHFIVSLMDHSWFISKDQGQTFQPYDGYGYERLYIQASPADSQTVYTSGPRASIVTVTRDGGENWQIPAQNGLPDNPPGKKLINGYKYYVRASIAPDVTDPATVYLGLSQELADGLGGGVYVSHDAGENWQSMSNGLPDLNYHNSKGFFENTNYCGNELTVSKAGTPIAMSIVYNYVCRWDKEKQIWTTVRVDAEHPWGLKDLRTDPFANRIWLSAATAGLLFSDDDGLTWHKLDSFPDSAGRISFDNVRPGRFTVMSNDGLYLTEDAGQSWWFYDFDNKQPGRNINAIAAIHNDTILLGTPNSGVFYHHIKRIPAGFARK